ncbi:unnamed protein product [Musa textilis]
MEYRHLALQSGIENWARVPALGCTSSFISDLADAVIEALPCASISNTRSAPSQCETATEPVPNVINLFFGSIFAFVLLLSPRLISAQSHLQESIPDTTNSWVSDLRSKKSLCLVLICPIYALLGIQTDV